MAVLSLRSFSRATTYSLLLAGTATIALSGFSARVFAATQTIGTDTTVAAPITGDTAAAQAGDLPGNDGGQGVIYNDPTITITNDSTITGGTASDGGPATGLGNQGGFGGIGVDLNDQFGASSSSHVTLINNGTIRGGQGANGSAAAASSGMLGGDGGGGGEGVDTNSADYAVITNHGFIYGGAAGVAGASDGVAPAANDGADGVALYVSLSNNVHIINDGTISSHGTALTIVAGSGLVIDNTGGTITSDGAETMFAHFDSGGFTLNGGTIINTSMNDSDEAIDINSTQSGPVTSSSTIIADGSGTAQGIAINYNAAQFAFDNFGTIRGQVIGSANSQTFVNEAGASLTGDINLGASADIFFINGGTVTGDISLGTGNDDVHINGGVVTGDISTGNNGDTIELNGGRVVGNIDMGTGVDTLLVEKDYTTEGTISSGGGGIELEVMNNKTFTINHAIDIGGGLLDVDAGAHLNLENGDFTTGSNIDNIGTVSIGVGRTLALGGTTPDTGTFIFKVADGAHFGQLTVSGDAVILQSATVKVNVENAGGLADGAQMKIGTGISQVIGLDGNPGQAFTTVDDDSFLYSFQIADGSQGGITAGGADNTQLYLVADKSALTSVASAGSQSIAAALDALDGSSDPDIQAVQDAIASASSAGEIEDILQSLQPPANAGTIMAAASVSGQVGTIAGTRLAMLREGYMGMTGMAAGDAPEGNRHVWAHGFGSRADQGERGNIGGYQADTYGFAAGADTAFDNDKSHAGVAVSYAKTNVDSDDINTTDADIESYQITLYGDYDLDDNAYIEGSAAYAYNSVDQTRHDVGFAGNTGNANYNANQFTMQAEAGRDFSVSRVFTLTPKGLAHYMYYKAGDYTEDDAGGIGLHVESDSLQIFEIGAGLDAKWSLKQADGTELAPFLSAGYRYDLIGDAVASTSVFTGGGAAFSTQGADPARGTVNIGAGVKYTMEKWELSARYDYEHKDSYNAHSGQMRAAYKF